MSHVSPGHVCPVVPVRPSLGTRGLRRDLFACAAKRERERTHMSEESVMSSRLRDLMRFTEDEGRDDTHHISGDEMFCAWIGMDFGRGYIDDT
jgi:hypothetical protein